MKTYSVESGLVAKTETLRWICIPLAEQSIDYSHILIENSRPELEAKKKFLKNLQFPLWTDKT